MEGREVPGARGGTRLPINGNAGARVVSPRLEKETAARRDGGGRGARRESCKWGRDETDRRGEERRKRGGDGVREHIHSQTDPAQKNARPVTRVRAMGRHSRKESPARHAECSVCATQILSPSDIEAS